MNPLPASPRLPRLVGVDLARGLAVLFMVAVHVLMVHGTRELGASPLGAAVEFLGGPPAAPVFMLLMGLSFAYSGKEGLGAGLGRGALVLGSGYLLNLLRGVLPVAAARLVAPGLVEELLGEGLGLLDLFLLGDILQFAGLALMVMALLRRLRAGRSALLALAIAVAGAAPLLWGLRSGLPPLDLLLDLLWGDRALPPPLENAICFPVFPWLAFPLVGMALGDALRAAAFEGGATGAGGASSPGGVPGAEAGGAAGRPTRRAGLVGLVLAGAGLAWSLTDLEWHFNDYYHARWGSMLFMVGFSLAWLALWDYAARRLPDNPFFRFLSLCSRRVTDIYFLQWILIDWGIALLGANMLGAAGAGALFVAVTALSCLGAGFVHRAPARGIASGGAPGSARPRPEPLAGLSPLPSTSAGLAAERFASAMMEDPAHAHFFPEPESRFRKLKAVYSWELACWRERCVATSPALEGLAIWEAPGARGGALSGREVMLGLGLLLSCGPIAVLRMLRYQLRATRLRRSLVAEPYWYLQVVAVAPEHQGKGHASALIRPILEAAKRAGQRVYLETHNPANVELYRRYGFEVVGRERMGDGALEHTCMVFAGRAEGLGIGDHGKA